MSNTLSIHRVKDKQGLRQFIDVAPHLYQDDPCFITPLIMERMETLSADKNPYFKHAEAQYWIAQRDGEPVGRISAQVDQLVHSKIDPKLGHMGMFEAINDETVAALLFKTAENWLKNKGMTQVQGPFNLSVNEECGLLIDGFDTPPMIMMGHGRSYYRALFEVNGYEKAKEMYAYLIDIQESLPPGIQRIVDMARRNRHLHVRPLDMKNFDRDLKTCFSIFNKAWAGNWGFVPFTDEEALHAAKSMKQVLIAEWGRIAYYDDEPVAFMIALPDINGMIGDLDGKLLPFGWVKFLWRLKINDIEGMRVPLMGILPEYQKKPVGAALALHMIEDVRLATLKRNLQRGELSWILEDNMGMRNIISRIESVVYKTYAIFEKSLLP